MRHILAASIVFTSLYTAFLSLTQIQLARAEIAWSGDIDPADPNTWTSDVGGYVGKTADGTLTVDGDDDLSSSSGYIGYARNATGQVTIDGAGSTWTNSRDLYVGSWGNGTLNITGGGLVGNSIGHVGRYSGSAGQVTVDGAGSMWTNSYVLYVGNSGNGTLNITDGGAVSNSYGHIGYRSGSTSHVTVDGAGSIWTSSGDLYVGYYGIATLDITGSGLVSVAGALTIDNDTDGDSFINMATAGMLALIGDADSSLPAFLDLINGTDAIRYWDDGISDWAPIASATYGEDYTLEYLTEGDLTGYTILTVGASSGFSADFDSDGDVDGDDFLIWQSSFNNDDGGDADGDGDTDGDDFVVWQSQFDSGTGSGLAASTAPEPATSVAFVMMLLGVLVVPGPRRARQN